MDIKRLLRKKKLTGRELGILVVTNLVSKIHNKVTLTSQDKLQSMLDKLEKPDDLLLFRKYSNIYHWLNCKLREALALKNRAWASCRTFEVHALLGIVEEDICGITDEIFRIISKNHKEFEDAEILSLIKGLKDRNNKCTLDVFYPESETYEHNSQILNEARETIVSGYSYVKGYNLALELITKTYDITDVILLQVDISQLESIINFINDIFHELYTTICRIHTRQKKQREKKLKVIKELYQPINYKHLVIPKEIINKAEQLLKAPNAFTEEWDEIFTELLIYHTNKKGKSNDK